MEASQVAIGIDLGTANSRVGIVENGTVKIIFNEPGSRTTPSYVAFTDSEQLVGDCAKDLATVNPTNTVFDSKRLIGRRFDELTAQANIKQWPFEVLNVGGKPKTKVVQKGETKLFAPKEISSMVLAYLKKTAEAYLGESITKAVITVPAYFTNAQRQATLDAGTKAGLNVLSIINEPTAAAIAYGFQKVKDKKLNVLVYDLGSTLDVTVISIDNGRFEVKATSRNAHLGGEDFNNRLVTYLVKQFKKMYRNKDLSTNKRALSRLQTAAEEVKRVLSVATETSIALDVLFEGIDFCFDITRARFEDLCSDLFLSTLEPVKDALKDAKLSKNQIDEIVLSGGLTQIPKVQQLLQNFFHGKTLNKSINPDETVAYGAALQAASLVNDPTMPLLDIIYLEDVKPFSLGLSTRNGKMLKIIERNATIPVTRTKSFWTKIDNQTEVKCAVFEGEHDLVSNNNFLGELNISGIPAAPAGVEKIDITFSVDHNGVLEVSAVNSSTGKQNCIVIDLDLETAM